MIYLVHFLILDRSEEVFWLVQQNYLAVTYFFTKAGLKAKNILWGLHELIQHIHELF